MRRVKISVLILLASLLLFAVCAFLLATRPTLMPTGVPGDSVEFGMTVDEVQQAAGSPDWAYQDAFWHRDCIYYVVVFLASRAGLEIRPGTLVKIRMRVRPEEELLPFHRCSSRPDIWPKIRS